MGSPWPRSQQVISLDALIKTEHLHGSPTSHVHPAADGSTDVVSVAANSLYLYGCEVGGQLHQQPPYNTVYSS